MKTKELIRRLQEEDPNGETEVTVNGADIYFLETLPGYYDGCFPVLIHDPKLVDKCYSIIGVEIRGGGLKVRLNTMDLRDVLLDHPEAEVRYDGEYAERHCKDRVEKIRQEMKDLYAKPDAETKQKKDDAQTAP